LSINHSTEYKFDINEEYTKVSRLCEKYKYNCFLRFNEIHIISKYEAWYLIPKENGVISLYHGNSIGQIQNGYHRQFSRKLTYEDILIYISEHENSKYKGKRTDFTFTKTGAWKPKGVSSKYINCRENIRLS